MPTQALQSVGGTARATGGNEVEEVGTVVQAARAMHAANVGVGAVVSFVGYVRDFNDGLDVAGMLKSRT